METNTLEKAETLAKESLTKIQAPAKEKAEAESKAAAEKLEKEKSEGLKEADAKAKEDVRLLTAEDSDLSEPELKRKAELQETKRKKDESPDEKIKRIQEQSQKRIDEIKSELLAKENQSAERLKKLEAELVELKRPKVEEDAQAKSKREEAERISKYVEEDKNKPKEDRREMLKDDLEAWYLEDPLSATEWIQNRSLRRSEERKEVESKARAKTGAEEFIAKQAESKLKLFAKYPGVNPSAEKLATFKGKTNTEISAALSAENEEFRICSEIVAEDPKKYLEAVNGPELVMAEMEKRLKKPETAGKSGKKTVTLTEEELEAKIQAEAERRANLEGEGVSSTKGKKLETTNKTKSELRQKHEAIARKAGMTVEQLDKQLERRNKIPGVSKFEDDNA